MPHKVPSGNRRAEDADGAGGRDRGAAARTCSIQVTTEEAILAPSAGALTGTSSRFSPIVANRVSSFELTRFPSARMFRPQRSAIPQRSAREVHDVVGHQNIERRRLDVRHLDDQHAARLQQSRRVGQKSPGRQHVFQRVHERDQREALLDPAGIAGVELLEIPDFAKLRKRACRGLGAVQFPVRQRGAEAAQGRTIAAADVQQLAVAGKVDVLLQVLDQFRGSRSLLPPASKMSCSEPAD